MNKFSNRLTDCRSRLLDAEAILNHLHHPENLHHLLENCSPEVTIGAMIDKAWDLVANASGDCEAMTEASEEDLKAELHQTVRRLQGAAPESQETDSSSFAQHIDTIDEIHEQSRSMLCMLMLYLSQAREGGETLTESMLENYTWQLQANMERAIEASCALSENLRKGAAQ
ncbi:MULTISPECIES: hypothetical protein [Marinobacter]|uniref:hypothetical protein n=1 Tax=Marinobacter TaxID=2742 RepID=UPI001B1C054E|nr:hypothetical protein [Marinobacter sp.]MBO6811721.1 hypothetical protein [Marinobacter sp.]MBO6875051.1 hypothetical protein [Marinobacter sp.]